MRACCVYGVKLYSKVDASLASLPGAAMALPELAADGARVEYHRLRRLVRKNASKNILYVLCSTFIRFYHHKDCF